MGEKIKFGLLLVVLVGIFLFEVYYIVMQIKACILQGTVRVKVFSKNSFKYTNIFSIVVGFLMIYTFSVSDSFIYNDSTNIVTTNVTLGYNSWHALYNLGKVTGITIIIGAVLSLFSRFAISEDFIITNNGHKLSKEKCMIAKNNNIMTVTYIPEAPKVPSVLLKFDTTTSSGQVAGQILEENYPKI